MMVLNWIPTTAALLLSFHVLSCSANKHNWTENSKVVVHLPTHLYEPHGSLHYRIPFGNYPRAKTHSNYVYYLNSTLCFDYAPQTPLHKGYPAKPKGGSFMLMVEGGNCSAVKKARLAQEYGASALLIAEPLCMCSWDPECKKEFPNDPCNDEQTPVTNDGSASDISIPSFIIFRGLGDKLKEQMVKHKEPALVELQWDLETDLDEGSKPTLHFWTSAYDENSVSLDTYTELQVVTNALADYAAFEPRFVLFDGKDFACHEGKCGTLCTNEGRYCSVAAPETTGITRMEETVRRMCVFRHYGLEKFWKYSIYHKEHCAAKNLFGDKKCWEKALKEASIHDHATVEQCLTDSGGFEGDNVNDFLDEAVKHIERAGVMPMPTLSIDHRQIPLSASSVLEEVCSQYWFSHVKSIPKVCETCGACLNTVGCLQHGKCVGFSNKQRHASQTGSSSHHGWKIFGSLILVSSLGAAAYYAYDKYTSSSSGGGGRSMGGLLNDYMQLGTEG